MRHVQQMIILTQILTAPLLPIVLIQSPLLSAPCLDLFYLGPVFFIISLYIVVFLCLVIPEAIQSDFKHCIVVAATTFSRKLFRTLTALCVKVYFHTSRFDIVLYSLR